MRIAPRKGAETELATTAHRLKNTVAYLGAWSALEANRHLEDIGRCGDLSQAPAAVERLARELERLKGALGDHWPKTV